MKTLHKKELFLSTALAGFVLYSSASHAISLEDVISKALKENPDFISQKQQHEISQENTTLSNSGYLPSLDLRAERGYKRSLSAASNENQEPARASVTLTQPIYSGLSTVYDVERAEAEQRQEALKTFSTAEQVSLSIAQAYLNVLRAEKSVELSQLNLDAHLRLKKVINELFNNGVKNRSDWTQMEGRTALSQSNMIITRNKLEDAKANYEALTGFSVDELEKPNVDANLVPVNLAVALSTAEKQHPLLKAAIETTNAASAQYKGAKSPYMPTLDLVLKSEWNDDDVDSSQIKSTDDRSIKLVANWNLFRGGADITKRKIASVQVNVAKNTRDNTRRQVMQEVRLAWAAYDSARNQKKFNKQHVTFSEETQDLYEQQFKVNRRTLLDLLDIENELFRARLAYVEIDYAELTSEYRLLRSTGRLLKALKIITYLDSESGKAHIN